MSSLNKVELIGRLGQDPEGRSMPNGEQVCNMSVATSEKWRDKNTGETKEATEWHRCVVFGKLANICLEYLTKGSLVYLEGKNKTRKWTDKDGIERYTTEVHCHEMKMLGGKSDGGRDGNTGSPARSQATAPAGQQSHAPAQGSKMDPDDDIPF